MSKLWTMERVALLRELCASEEKLSAPTIAAKLSERFAIQPPLTRAAVVGKARRCNIRLPLPRTPKKEPGPARATPQHNVLAFPLRRPNPEPDRRVTIRPTILPDDPQVVEGVYLLNASDLDCRFPITDPPQGQRHLLRVCGKPVERRLWGGSGGYCASCADRMVSKSGHGRGPFVLPTKRGLK